MYAGGKFDSTADSTASIMATALVNVSERAQVSIAVSNDRHSGLKLDVALCRLEGDAAG